MHVFIYDLLRGDPKGNMERSLRRRTMQDEKGSFGGEIGNTDPGGVIGHGI